MCVYQKISKVMADLSKIGIGKNQKNKFQNYNYRGIDDLYEVMAKVLAENKLVILPRMEERQENIRKSHDGKTVKDVIIKMVYELVDAEEPESKLEIPIFNEAFDNSDKATNKALSACYKYLCFQLFAIPLSGDDSEKDDIEITQEEPKVKTMSEVQVNHVAKMLDDSKSCKAEFLKHFGVPSLEKAPEDMYGPMVAAIETKMQREKSKKGKENESNND